MSVQTQTITDRPSKDHTYDPQNTVVLEYIDFTDSHGNFRSASLAGADGAHDDYLIRLPASNPVGSNTRKGFINSHMPSANDQVLVCSPRLGLTVN